MRIRFARRPPLFRGKKSTKLSPVSADKPLDCAAFSRITPAARMRPISARRACADMCSGHRGLGPEIGVSCSSSMGAPFGLVSRFGHRQCLMLKPKQLVGEGLRGRAYVLGTGGACHQWRVARFTWESVSSLRAAFQRGVLVKTLSCDRKDFAGRVSCRRPVQIKGRKTCVYRLAITTS